MPTLQFLGVLSLLAALGVTLLAGSLWLRTQQRGWGRLALGTAPLYGILLVVVAVARGDEVLPAGTPLRFCGFYIDCHLSVAVTDVARTPSAWIVTLRVASDAKRVALTPHGFKVELDGLDSLVRLPLSDPSLPSTPIEAGGSREVTVAFAAPPDGATPILRVTQGVGVDRVIEGVLLGDDDALGRARVTLGL